MKTKHLISLLTALCATAATQTVAAQAESVPYKSDMCEDEAWTFLDANDDGISWDDLYDDYYIKESGFEYGKWYKCNRNLDADDWLYSPAITLEAGKKYVVSFWGCARDVYEAFSLSMASSKDALKTATQLYKYDTGNDNASTDCQKIVCNVTPETAGDYYFGFHVTSEADGSGVYLTGFDIKEYEFEPGPVTGLKAVAATDGAISCKISWTLPTTDVNGGAFPAGAEVEKVTIYRDETKLKDLDKNAVEFNDTEADGLTSGFHTYAVVATVGGKETPKAEVRSGYIGNISEAQVPWSVSATDITADDFEAFWNVVKGENSTVPEAYGWQLKTSYVRFDPRSKNNVEDDWLVSPRLKIETPGIYRFKIKAQYTSNPDPVKLELYTGKNRTPSASDRKLGEFTSLPAEAGEVWITFRVQTAGEYYFALHECREELESSKPIDIYTFAVESWKEMPLNVTELKVENSGNNAVISWRNPSTNNIGEQITKLDRVEIKRNGTVITTLTENLTPGDPSTYTDSPEKGGIFTYSVVPYIGENALETAPAAVSSGWIGDKTRELPYTVDFTASPAIDEIKALWEMDDNDKDGTLWAVSNTSFNLQLNADGGTTHDTLLTPPLDLKQGHVYKITISATGAQEDFPISAEVRYEATTAAEKKVNAREASATPGNQILLNGTETAESYVASVAAPTTGKARIALVTDPEFTYTTDLDPVRIKTIKVEDSGLKTGVNEIIDNESNVTKYYDLTDIRIANPVKGNIYIRVAEDGIATKIRY